MDLILATAAHESLDGGIERFLQREAQGHRDAFDALLASPAEPFGRMLVIWEGAIRGGGKLLIFGNGGSAAEPVGRNASVLAR